MMLLNSGLTSEQTMQPGLTFAFCNLLDDSYHKNGIPLQKDRLPKMAKTFTNIGTTGTASVNGWCELTDPDNAFILAEQIGHQVVDEPHQYSPREWMAVTVDPSVPINESAEFIRYGKKREGFRPGFLTLKIAGIRVKMVHHPHHIVDAKADRHEGTEMLLETYNPDQPEIIFGDFNCLSFHIPRAVLEDYGFIEVHADNRPSYPNHGYRGKTFPRLLPSVSLDGFYVSPRLTVTEAGVIENDFADHRGLYATVAARRALSSSRSERCDDALLASL